MSEKRTPSPGNLQDEETLGDLSDYPFGQDMKLALFKGRYELFDPYRERWEEDMSKIIRFSHHAEMTHHVTLKDHAHIVKGKALVLAELLVNEGLDINTFRVEQLAIHHDDPEVLTSDIPGNEKRAMTPEQRAKLYSEEEISARLLSHRYLPPEFQQLYMEYFYENAAKQTVEAQLVDIADKATGLAETINGLRCGDTTLIPVLEEYRRIVEDLKRHPVFPKVARFAGLDHVPTLEEVQALPPISLSLLDQGEKAFWQQVLDRRVPKVVYSWMVTSLMLSTPGHNVLFPAWQDQIDESDAAWALYDPLTA